MALRLPSRSAPLVGRDRRQALLVALGLGLAIAVRVVLIVSPGAHGDIDTYAAWVHGLATDVPFGAAYRIGIAYMPVVAGVFGALAHVVPGFASATDASSLGIRVALKVPPLIADIATSVGVYFLANGRRVDRAGAAVAVALVPATWYVSAWWGQYDAIYVAAAVWVVVLAVREHRLASAVLFGLAMMTKPQALFLAVPIAAWMVARWHGRQGIGALLLAVAVAAGTWLPFVPWGGVADYLHGVTRFEGGGVAVLSFGAWNFWWLIQGAVAGDKLVSDSVALLGPLTSRAVGYVLVAGGEALIALAMIRRPTPDRLLLGLAAATLVAFAFMTTMHERYSLGAIVFLAPLLTRPGIRLAWAVLAATVTLNILATVPPHGSPGSLVPLSGPIGAAGSLVMLALTVSVVARLIQDRAPTTPAGVS